MAFASRRFKSTRWSSVSARAVSQRGELSSPGFRKAAPSRSTGLRHPERLAGIIALSTYLVDIETLVHEASPANRDVPIFMAHGTRDPMVRLEWGEASRLHSCNRLSRGVAHVSDAALSRVGRNEAVGVSGACWLREFAIDDVRVPARREPLALASVPHPCRRARETARDGPSTGGDRIASRTRGDGTGARRLTPRRTVASMHELHARAKIDQMRANTARCAGLESVQFGIHQHNPSGSVWAVRAPVGRAIRYGWRGVGRRWVADRRRAGSIEWRCDPRATARPRSLPRKRTELVIATQRSTKKAGESRPFSTTTSLAIGTGMNSVASSRWTTERGLARFGDSSATARGL
jgi:hypothetical protein